MKRFFVIVLAGCLILCILTACTKKTKHADDTTANDNVNVTDLESTSEPKNTDSNKHSVTDPSKPNPGGNTSSNTDSSTASGFGVVVDWSNGTDVVTKAAT